MKVSQLHNKTIYIDELADLTSDGQADQPTDFTLRETNGDVILKIRRYPDFSGQILLDFTDVLLPYCQPKNPLTVTVDDKVILPLSLTVRKTSPPYTENTYDFSLCLIPSSARYSFSDIDFLRIPESGRIPISGLLEAGTAPALVSESSEGSEIIHTFPSRAAVCIYNCATSPEVVRKDSSGRFRLGIRTSSVLYSPVYQASPGVWELYLFRNRHGFLEYFPMCGALDIVPSYTFENACYGEVTRKVAADTDVILQQYTGPLTRRASAVLADMLKDGYAFHYVRGMWNRIVIEAAEINMSGHNGLHLQRFSFRYQQPSYISLMI